MQNYRSVFISDVHLGTADCQAEYLLDFLNLVTALNKRFGIPIPEPDYPRFASFAGAAAYLAEKVT